MQRSSRLQCMQRKHLHFSVILRPWVLVPPPPENWPGDLPLCSQALYRLSLSCRREREWVDTFPVFDRFLKLFQIMPSQSEICSILFLRWPVKVVIEKDDKSLFVSFNAKKHAEQLRKKKISFLLTQIMDLKCLLWVMFILDFSKGCKFTLFGLTTRPMMWIRTEGCLVDTRVKKEWKVLWHSSQQGVGWYYDTTPSSSLYWIHCQNNPLKR